MARAGRLGGEWRRRPAGLVGARGVGGAAGPPLLPVHGVPGAPQVRGPGRGYLGSPRSTVSRCGLRRHRGGCGLAGGEVLGAVVGIPSLSVPPPQPPLECGLCSGRRQRSWLGEGVGTPCLPCLHLPPCRTLLGRWRGGGGLPWAQGVFALAVQAAARVDGEAEEGAEQHGVHLAGGAAAAGEGPQTPPPKGTGL